MAERKSGKYTYVIYGLKLASDYEFSQFLHGDFAPEEADILIEYGGITDDIMKIIEMGYGTGYKFHNRWFKNDVGIFWIHDDRKINFIEYDKGTIDDAAGFLPGLCLSILLWFRKDIMIHGACLRLHDKTFVISGNSGSGKSTVATEFIKRGAMLIADDVTAVRKEDGGYFSYPAFPAQKLCRDQVEKNNMDVSGLRLIRYDLNKYEIPRFDNFFDQKSKVDFFFRLEAVDGCIESSNSGFRAEMIEGAEKIRVITDSIFINWLFSGNFKFEPDDMFRCLGFADKICIHKIYREKGKDTLGGILDYIESNIE